MSRRLIVGLSAVLAFFLGGRVLLAQFTPSLIVDHITLGQEASEKAHQWEASASEIILGGLGQPARRLLPLQSETWEGGSCKFMIQVDPDRQNFATVKLWGSDRAQSMLILLCEGKQIGYRHLGDFEILDSGSDEPAFINRFIYTTTPLPRTMTQGKKTIQMEIRTIGPIWGYGQTFDKYQKPMTEPTRGLYALYTHTEPYFIPPPEEKQGTPVRSAPGRTAPGAEVMDRVKERVTSELKKYLESKVPINQMQMQFLAKAYHVSWTPAYQNPLAVQQVVKSLDALFMAYRKNPRLAEADPATYNPEWFGLGPAGDALRLLDQALPPSLDAEISDGTGTKLRRRTAYAEMLVASRDWHRQHRRLYTNQTMINDLYGIYLTNRGLALVAPAQALPEEEVRRYLYESVGLEPWRDSDPGGEVAVETAGQGWNVGADYWQITAKGLTRELGYVGYYGEVLDWATDIYEATRPSLDQPGDEKIRRQLIKMAQARASFRYPGLDSDGNRAMRIEAVVGWRDGGHYPGDITYAERVSWAGSGLGWVAATLDPQGVGYVQQMFQDNQFFTTLEKKMENKTFRVTAGLLAIPDDYERLQAQSPQNSRLPMTPGQPDFVFSDEEDGVVAIKNGDEVLYASLYWRARNAINFLAKVHYTTPEIDRIAVVTQKTEFQDSGLFYTRPDYINFGFGNGGVKYPGDLSSAHAGEKLPIAKIPDGLKFKPGDESVYAGKGDFYTMEYGAYFIAMNLSKDKTFALPVPEKFRNADDLVTRQPAATIKEVAPRSTVVLYQKP